MYRQFSIELKMVKDKTLNYPNFNNPNQVFEAYKTLSNKDSEEFHIACLDTKNNLIGGRMVSRGSVSGSIVHPREVFKLAILKNATSIICVHNHPSGDPQPSAEDISITERIVSAGKILGINILDHIIIGDDTFYSFRENNPLIFH